MKSGSGRINTRALGLDLGVKLVRFLTGRENLHYGYWPEGLDVCAGNLRQAQETYTKRLFNLLPDKTLRVLDVGGGAGETARDLALLGHEVEVVVPSEYLAARCRENAGEAVRVICTRFEDFPSNSLFDVCLFSESFQYIEVDTALDKALSLLGEGGIVVIADCFRSEAYYEEAGEFGLVGGGHRLADFRAALQARPVKVVVEEDITEGVAPSIELEQEFFNVVGQSIGTVDREFAKVFPRRRGLAIFLLRMLVSQRRRTRIQRRLFGQFRTADAFCRYNRYLMMRLEPTN